VGDTEKRKPTILWVSSRIVANKVPEAVTHVHHFTLSSKPHLHTNFTWKKLIIFDSLPLGSGLETGI
jgi:hypothetical protein